MVFILTEVGLRLARVAEPEEYTDPHVGFSAVYPLFEADDDPEFLRTSHSRHVFFGLQRFPVEKEPSDGRQRVFRAFVLGGSTVRGRPYETRSSLTQWLELEIEGRNPDIDAQVINCGGLSYASYRLRPILEEVLEYEPDLIVLATGHNEFLEDRTYREQKNRSGFTAALQDAAYSLRLVKVARQFGESLVGEEVEEESEEDQREILDSEVKARLDESSGYASYERDDRWREQVVAHFEESIHGMVRMCEQAEVPVLLVQLGANLRDTPPFKPQHSRELTAEQEREFTEHFEAAEQSEASDPDTALESYRVCESIDPRDARLLYRMARCYDQLNQFTAAREYYQRALEEDVCPLRKTTALSEVLRRVSAETNTSLVDVEAVVFDQSADGIPGYDVFVDHVHPTIGVHQLMGRMLADQLSEDQILDLASEWPSRRRVYREHLESLGPSYLANGNRRVQWLEGWARRQRLIEESVPRSAADYLRNGMRILSFGQREQALTTFMLATASDSATPHMLLEECRGLVEQGRCGDAEFVLEQLPALMPSESDLAEIELARIAVALEAGKDVQIQDLTDEQAERVRTAIDSSSDWLQYIPPAVATALKTRSTAAVD